VAEREGKLRGSALRGSYQAEALGVKTGREEIGTSAKARARGPRNNGGEVSGEAWRRGEESGRALEYAGSSYHRIAHASHDEPRIK
jgi:hypothetical protein